MGWLATDQVDLSRYHHLWSVRLLSATCCPTLILVSERKSSIPPQPFSTLSAARNPSPFSFHCWPWPWCLAVIYLWVLKVLAPTFLPLPLPNNIRTVPSLTFNQSRGVSSDFQPPVLFTISTTTSNSFILSPLGECSTVKSDTPASPRSWWVSRLRLTRATAWGNPEVDNPRAASSWFCRHWPAWTADSSSFSPEPSSHSLTTFVRAHCPNICSIQFPSHPLAELLHHRRSARGWAAGCPVLVPLTVV